MEIVQYLKFIYYWVQHELINYRPFICFLFCVFAYVHMCMCLFKYIYADGT